MMVVARASAVAERHVAGRVSLRIRRGVFCGKRYISAQFTVDNYHYPLRKKENFGKLEKAYSRGQIKKIGQGCSFLGIF
jgi:hypothetical protein